MDVVYPLGPQTKWSHNEIRYSIRSMLKHCTDAIGDIYVIGEKPAFFDYSKIHWLSFKPDPKLAKELRIWEKVLHACHNPDISEEFFFMNDDFFFLQDFSINNYPYFHKGDLKDYKWAGLEIQDIKNGYDKKSKRTLEFLLRNNFSTYMYDIHRPNKVNKQKFIEVYEKYKKDIRAEERHGNGSLCINSTYLNAIGVKGVRRKDLKITNQDFSVIKDQEIFSIGDDAYGSALKKVLQELYPNPSVFEVNMKKVRVEITGRFTDSKSGILYTPGVFSMTPDNYRRLQREGRKVILVDGEIEPMVTHRGDAKKSPEVIQEKPSYTPVIPSDFPERELLVENGFETLKSFEREDIEDELKKIKGLTKAKITKIALALETEQKKYS